MRYIYNIAFILLFALFSVNVHAQSCTFKASFTKSDSDCEANGIVRIKVQDTAKFENIRYGLFSKTGSSYPPEYQIKDTLRNVPPGVYDVRVAAKCKGENEEDHTYNVGEVEIIGTYITINLRYDDCGTGAPLQIHKLENLVIPKIMHTSQTYGGAITFQTYQLDDNKKIAIKFSSAQYTSEPDYFSYMYYFSNYADIIQIDRTEVGAGTPSWTQCKEHLT